MVGITKNAFKVLKPGGFFVVEVQYLYDTLKDGLTNKKVKRSLNESIGMASRSVGIGPNKVNAKPIVESNEMVDRFKKLAGII